MERIVHICAGFVRSGPIQVRFSNVSNTHRRIFHFHRQATARRSYIKELISRTRTRGLTHLVKRKNRKAAATKGELSSSCSMFEGPEVPRKGQGDGRGLPQSQKVELDARINFESREQCTRNAADTTRRVVVGIVYMGFTYDERWTKVAYCGPIAQLSDCAGPAHLSPAKPRGQTRIAPVAVGNHDSLEWSRDGLRITNARVFSDFVPLSFAELVSPPIAETPGSLPVDT